MPATQNCARSVTASKSTATASLASGSVREHAVVGAGSGRPRESAVPRHWQATYLMLITVRSQNVCRTCFVLCSVFSMKQLPTHRHGREKKNSPLVVPNISCVRLVRFTDVGVSRASPSSLLWNTLEFCQALLSAILAEMHDPRQETPTFTQTTPLSAYIFSFCFFLEWSGEM